MLYNFDETATLQLLQNSLYPVVAQLLKSFVAMLYNVTFLLHKSPKCHISLTTVKELLQIRYRTLIERGKWDIKIL